MRLKAFLIVVMLLLSGCASRSAPVENDPWEPMNRSFFTINEFIDGLVIRPIAIAYDFVLPDPIQVLVTNFFGNLQTPVDIVNLALQGKFRAAGVETGRFALNSTLGFAGFTDLATAMDIPDYEEDFGQTFAVWGWRDSRYLVLPFFGPSTIRDAVGRFPATYLYWPNYWARDNDIWYPLIIDAVNQRARFLGQEGRLRDAYDRYALVRDAYLQRREFLITDGQGALPDYEEFLDDEFLDEDYEDLPPDAEPGPETGEEG